MANKYTDFLFRISMGLVAGAKTVFKFGYNDDVDSGTVPEDVWTGGGLYPWPTSAAVLSVVSTSTDDTLLGTGARTIKIVGLDENYETLEEEVELNGTTPVLTTSSFFRVHRMYVVTAGTDTANIGRISASHGATGLAYIEIGDGQTEMAIYTVCKGCELYLDTWYVSVQKKVAGSITCHLEWRAPGGAWRLAQTMGLSATGTSTMQRDTKLWFKVPEKSDIRVHVSDADSNDFSIVSSFDGIEVNRDEFTW